ncbi:MAG: PEP/pyruvate-binding domain-containing protein [Thermodesulfovibrionales bacterium]|nr:PEP/pyruvate-binding domain-containing protein [Thermodesulfovibrionales bacterium]
MRLWKQLSGILRKPAPREEIESGRAFLLKKFHSFHELLSQNNSVLELMADMEEKLSGEFLIDRPYINTIMAIGENVRKIVDKLNEISEEKYHNLYDRFNMIYSEIERFLARRKEIPVSSYTIPFDEITREMTDSLGNKNANLGEVRNHLRIPTPEGFAISAFAFKRFMEHNELVERINKVLFKLPVDNLDVLNSKSRELQEQIIKAEIPYDIEREIRNAYSRLYDKYGKKVMVSVRSSALLEDGEFSFAGQYSTFLNVPPDLIPQRYKEVIASLFTPRAIFYYKTKGLHEYEMVMSVGVVVMIDAKAAGVMYSRDPNNPKADTLIISVVRGLGKYIVEGVVTPETYVLSIHPLEIIKRTVPEQKSMLICRPDGEVEEVPLPEEIKGKPSLSDEQIKSLAEYAIAIENHYKSPQDIEWAIDKDGRPYILQTRPLMILTREPTRPVPIHVAGYNILIDKGIIVCKGIGFGKAYIVRTEEDLENFPEGAVLVAKHTSTKYVTVMNKASAIITDVGGTTVHLATIAREFQIPTIFDTGVATVILRNGQEITVDAINCNIYEGHVKELEEFAEKKEEPFKGTRLFKTFEKVLRWIVPLNLVDPEDERFKPEFCETLHDITRFAHQKAMQEMFKISEELPEDVERIRLVAGIPLLVYLIDLGGGIKGAPQKLTPEYISSVSFNAFLKGLISLEWPGPRHVDVKGFLGMIAETAAIPEVELERIGEESFSFISREYMNFSIRLGYHLSVIEAYTGENINDNYIRFFFKGGGASRERRLRRVKLISEILKKIDFDVKVTEDVIDAIITKYKKSQLKEKLEVLGRLTVYTKQLDAIMHDDATTELHMEEFIREHLKIKVES